MQSEKLYLSILPRSQPQTALQQPHKFDQARHNRQTFLEVLPFGTYLCKIQKMAVVEMTFKYHAKKHVFHL